MIRFPFPAAGVADILTTSDCETVWGFLSQLRWKSPCWLVTTNVTAPAQMYTFEKIIQSESLILPMKISRCQIEPTGTRRIMNMFKTVCWFYYTQSCQSNWVQNLISFWPVGWFLYLYNLMWLRRRISISTKPARQMIEIEPYRYFRIENLTSQQQETTQQIQEQNFIRIIVWKMILNINRRSRQTKTLQSISMIG